MAETEKKIIKDIKENKIGKYQEKDLFELIKKANLICDKVKFDTPLSPEIENYGLLYTTGIAFDATWRVVRNLQESIDIALDKRQQWENPDDEKIYIVLSSMRQALHKSLAWLTSSSKYKDAYRWLDEKESFYQQELAERNERAVDPFKKAQWNLELKNKEKGGIPKFESQMCTWTYQNSYVGKDGYFYNIDKDGNVKKSDLTLAEVLARNNKNK